MTFDDLMDRLPMPPERAQRWLSRQKPIYRPSSE